MLTLKWLVAPLSVRTTWMFISGVIEPGVVIGEYVCASADPARSKTVITLFVIEDTPTLSIEWLNCIAHAKVTIAAKLLPLGVCEGGFLL